MQELNIRALADRAIRGWKTSASLAFLFAVFVIITLPLQRPVYNVSMTVMPAPNEQEGMATSSSGALSTLVSLAGGNGAGGNNSNYSRYQKLLTSPVVAQRMDDHHGMLRLVFASNWNKADQKWVPTTTARGMMTGWLLELAHVPTWSPPDATELARFLTGKLLIVPSTQNDIVTISMADYDPDFARHVMLAAHEEANNVLRDQVASRAKQQVAYLESKLSQTTVSDYRATLLQILSAQEKTLMLTQTSASFAAQILSPPVASATPISPRPVLDVFVAVVAGILTGMMITIFAGPEWWHGAQSLLFRRKGRRTSEKRRASPSAAK